MESINNQNIDNENPLCLIFSDVGSYIIEEKGNKYLIFALTKNNREVLELYKNFWSEIKKDIKVINSGESVKYKEDLMKIRFDSYDDDLSLGKILSFSVLNIVVESVFQIEDVHNPRIHIHECEYECEH